MSLTGVPIAATLGPDSGPMHMPLGHEPIKVLVGREAG